MSDDAVTVGRRIRSRREALAMSREDLAELLGTTVAAVDGMETGETPAQATILHALHLILAVPVSWFFDRPSDCPATDPEAAWTVLHVGRSYERVSEAVMVRRLVERTASTTQDDSRPEHPGRPRQG